MSALADRVVLHHGDSREVLKDIADASVDSVVTDPPYALVSIGKRFGSENAAPVKVKEFVDENGQKQGSSPYMRASAGFMGQKWDTGETAFDPAFWSEVLRVLKPGGHCFAFGGQRTYHRLVCAMEDAGFEIREMHAWIFGSGFPKSHDVAKAIDRAAGATPEARQWEGWGTATKPAMEPICLARKPLGEKTIAANVLRHGTGALNIEACRVPLAEPDDRDVGGVLNRGQRAAGAWGMNTTTEDHSLVLRNEGRWPANVVHDGSEEVLAAFPEASGQQRAPGPQFGGMPVSYGGYGPRPPQEPLSDDGSAARFFYCAKAGEIDRLGSMHPTVKPVDLMSWLIKLITPPGGVVLDPFAGTGSTGIAAMVHGFQAILIEREATYAQDIRRRVDWAAGNGQLTAQAAVRKPAPAASTPSLFDL